MYVFGNMNFKSYLVFYYYYVIFSQCCHCLVIDTAHTEIEANH